MEPTSVTSLGAKVMCPETIKHEEETIHRNEVYEVFCIHPNRDTVDIIGISDAVHNEQVEEIPESKVEENFNLLNS